MTMRSTSTSPSPHFHRYCVFSIATYVSYCFLMQPKKHSSTLFTDIPCCSRTCGFQHWDQMDLSDESEYKIVSYVSICIIKIPQVSLISFCFFFFFDRMGLGMATCHPTSTWTPTSISSCPVFCSKLGKDASSSPALTQTSAQCKSTHACVMSLLSHWTCGCRCWITPCYYFFSASLRVRNKQNKYPILFLTQGISEMYPELMDIRCQTTQIAISFAQSENILVSFVVVESRMHQCIAE